VRALHVLRALVDPVLYFRGSARKYGNMKYRDLVAKIFLAPEAGPCAARCSLAWWDMSCVWPSIHLMFVEC